MSTISQVMDQLVTVQGKLAITSPAAVSVKKAWPFFPPNLGNVAVATPAFVNEWTLTRLERHVGLRVEFYTVHSQLLVLDADLNRAAEIATAFMPEILEAFDAQDGDGDGGVSLGGTVTSHELRGGNPTLAKFERQEGAYMGLDLFLDIEIKSSVDFS